LERAKSGKLYLVPTPLSADSDPVASLPPAALEPLRALRSFVVENEKTALRFLSRVLDRDAMAAVSLAILDEHTPPASVPPLLAPALSGADLGLLSEAGCPAVADPGALLVRQERAVLPLPRLPPARPRGARPFAQAPRAGRPGLGRDAGVHRDAVP